MGGHSPVQACSPGWLSHVDFPARIPDCHPRRASLSLAQAHCSQGAFLGPMTVAIERVTEQPGTVLLVHLGVSRPDNLAPAGDGSGDHCAPWARAGPRTPEEVRTSTRTRSLRTRRDGRHRYWAASTTEPAIEKPGGCPQATCRCRTARTPRRGRARRPRRHGAARASERPAAARPPRSPAVALSSKQ